MIAKRTCTHVKDDGNPCEAVPVSGSEYCFFHDPKMREEHQQATSKGGSARQFKGGLPPVAIDKPEDVCTLLAQTINELRAGDIPPQVANSIGYLAGQYSRSYETAVLAKKLDTLAQVMGRR